MGASPPTTIDYTPWGTTYSGNIDKGYGYAYYHETQTLTHQGEINVSNYTVQTKEFNGGTADEQGWNLVSNSFTSAIDWDDVVNAGWDNDIENAIYLFDDDAGTGYQANYRYYVATTGGSNGAYGIGTGSATKNIPIGQGFFVKTGKNNQNLVFEAGNRVHSGQAFYKGEAHNNLCVTAKYCDLTEVSEFIIN